MVDTQRAFLCGNVVAQHQITLIGITAHSGNGSDGVVGRSIGFRKNERLRIAVAPPVLQHQIARCCQRRPVLTLQTDDRHGPF